MSMYQAASGAALFGMTVVPVFRHEIRDLTPAAWSAFVAAAKVLGAGPGPTMWDWLTKTNIDHQDIVRNGSAFLPYNRYFLITLEDALMRINPDVSIPYWDSGLDSARPDASPVLSDAYFGGNGAGAGHAVGDGRFAHRRAYYPRPHPTARRYDRITRLSGFPSTEDLSLILARSETYDQLRRALETGPWGGPLAAIGGDMATAASPNDPLEWTHRAHIDMLWARWQAERGFSYDGHHADGRRASVHDRLPIGARPPVSKVLNSANIFRKSYTYVRAALP
jgi:tyrosinase